MRNTIQKGPKVLIVGGGHGMRVHLPALKRAGFNVTGLVGRDMQRTQKVADENDIPRAFDDLVTAIETTKAQAVTVASPPHTHAQMVLTAIESGLHVLCEKPFAKDAREAERIVKAAEHAGIVNIVGNQMRTLPERIVIGNAIKSGLIGEPRLLTFVQHVNLVADPTTERPVWWFDENEGGGWLGASGSHLIDQIHSWLGDFRSLSAATPMLSDRKGVAEDSFDMRFTLANGGEGVISQTGGSWGPNAMMCRVMGTRGTVWIEGGEAWIADRDGSRKLPVTPELLLDSVEPNPHPRKKYLHIELPPSIRMCEAWRDAIEGNKPRSHLATFRDGLAAMKVIDAARKSASENGSTIVVER